MKTLHDEIMEGVSRTLSDDELNFNVGLQGEFRFTKLERAGFVRQARASVAPSSFRAMTPTTNTSPALSPQKGNCANGVCRP